MSTIQATVNPRLLTKADRLFTGSLEGRVIEILQNARRAGATRVEITNTPDGRVVVRDNGRGIEDFEKLLDLGGSGWEESLEGSEDPAGVGLFCLAPREVVVRSRGQRVSIGGEAWRGEPVEIEADAEVIDGTELCFADEPWSLAAVERHAVFCGMAVSVDGVDCPREPFISERGTAYPELGCRIEVRESKDLGPWHHTCSRGGYYGGNVLVNFHGQTVGFVFHAASEHHLSFLVELTGESTAIRLMLPARTQLVENQAYTALQSALEIEAYHYLQRRGHHRLAFKEYLRARALGVILPEATPTFDVGLLSGDSPEPVLVSKPEDMPLLACYRLSPDLEQDDQFSEINAHLLAALGKCAEPFVHVRISEKYDGYSWAKLPTIDRVEFQAGKVLRESWLWSGQIVCVDRIEITAHTSDGQVFSSPVCMGIPPVEPTDSGTYCDEVVYVTPQAQEQLSAAQIWYHFGGWYEDGDTYETQESQFSDELERFWALLLGRDEQLRRNLFMAAESIKPKWRTVMLLANGTVQIRFKSKNTKVVRPSAR